MPFNLADFCTALSKYLKDEFDMAVTATQENDGSFFLDIEFDGDDWYIGASAMPGVVIKYAGEFDLKAIDPSKYFLTTGDAIIKTSVLEKDLFRAAIMARKMKDILIKLKDKSVHLETRWENGSLIVMKKDPRKKKIEDITSHK